MRRVASRFTGRAVVHSFCELLFDADRALLRALLSATTTADTDKVGKSLLALHERVGISSLDLIEVCRGRRANERSAADSAPSCAARHRV